MSDFRPKATLRFSLAYPCFNLLLTPSHPIKIADFTDLITSLNFNGLGPYLNMYALTTIGIRSPRVGAQNEHNEGVSELETFTFYQEWNETRYNAKKDDPSIQNISLAFTQHIFRP